MLLRLIVSFVVFLTASCASNPIKTQFASSYAGGFLPFDSPVIGQFDLEKFPRLQKTLLKYPSLRSATERTKKIWFSFKIDKMRPQNWIVVADGDFPKLGTELVLGWDKNWTKHPHSVLQWAHDRQNFFITVPEEHIVVASSEPFQENQLVWQDTLFQTYPTTFWEGAELTLIIRSPIELLLGKMAATMLRIQEAWLLFDPSSTGLTGRIILKMSTKKAAENGLVVIKLIKGSLETLWEEAWGKIKNILPLFEAFYHVEWTQEGDTILGHKFEIGETWVDDLFKKLLPKEQSHAKD